MKGPISQLGALLLIGSAFQIFILNHCPAWCKDYPLLHNTASKYLLFGKDEWMMTGLILFAFVLGIGLTCVIWFAVSTIVFLISIPLRVLPRQHNLKKASVRQFVVHLTVLLGLLGFIPSSTLFAAYFILWLLMTSSSRVSARSDLSSFQNIYNYRLSWLVFLTSLLPYFIPSVIAYIKDILIGWTHHTISPITIVQDLPPLLILIYLMTLGKTPDTLDAK